ncbi:MAG: enoyl-CoA hydratase-related protein [Gemmatimonadota bacterium]|nr:enoyl-CoA hydratase-related protein [Gemmatimonadota bacterium]
MSENRYVRTRIDDAIATVIIDRQSKLNALNPQVVAEIDGAFAALRDEGSVRAVILTGAGDKAFVAGADIGVLARMDPLSGVGVSREGQDILRRIELFPKPVIAAVGGYALGGGCELALACHLRVASDRARFGLPEVSLGIIPGYGGTVRLTRVVGLGRAVEMILSGDMIDAQRAAEMGLANLVVPHDELLERTRTFAGRIARNAPVALEMALKSIYQAVESPMDQAQATEATMFGLLASTDDMKEGMAAFLEKRKARFSGR